MRLIGFAVAILFVAISVPVSSQTLRNEHFGGPYVYIDTNTSAASD